MRPFAFLDVVTLLIFLTACPLHAQESRSKAETDPPNAEPALDDIQEEFDKRRDAERLLSFAGGAVVALVGITLPAYFLVAANKNSAADKFQDCMDKEITDYDNKFRHRELEKYMHLKEVRSASKVDWSAIRNIDPALRQMWTYCVEESDLLRRFITRNPEVHNKMEKTVQQWYDERYQAEHEQAIDAEGFAAEQPRSTNQKASKVNRNGNGNNNSNGRRRTADVESFPAVGGGRTIPRQRLTDSSVQVLERPPPRTGAEDPRKQPAGRKRSRKNGNGAKRNPRVAMQSTTSDINNFDLGALAQKTYAGVRDSMRYAFDRHVPGGGLTGPKGGVLRPMPLGP